MQTYFFMCYNALECCRVKNTSFYSDNTVTKSNRAENHFSTHLSAVFSQFTFCRVLLDKCNKKCYNSNRSFYFFMIAWIYL